MSPQAVSTIFKDLVVIELASVLAGPAVGLFFAELGAKVIKVENPKTKGDVTRHWKHSNDQLNSQISSYYASVNAFKEILFCDIGEDNGYNKVRELISCADIVIMNFKEGDQEKFKLQDETILQINPQIIIGKIKGFSSQPERVAYDVVLQAECGFMSMNGTNESGPLKMPVAIIDLIAAHQLKEGILVALIKRIKSNKGSVVSVTLEDSGISSLANQASSYLMTNKIPERIGSLHPTIAPYGEVLICKDGKGIVLAVGSDKQFVTLLHALRLDHLLELSEFQTNAERVKNRELLLAHLLTAANQFNRDDLMNLLLIQQVPCGAIKDLQEVFDYQTINQHVLIDRIEDTECKRVKSVAFEIKY